MKIFETLILSQEAQFFEELTSFLKLENEKIMDLDVYRLEIDEDLVFLMYHLDPERKIPRGVLEHLGPHLTAFLVITNGEFGEILPSTISTINDLAKDLSGTPTIMAIRADTRLKSLLNETVGRDGLYLCQKGRVVFWDPDSPATKKQVFQLLWKDLLSASAGPEAMPD